MKNVTFSPTQIFKPTPQTVKTIRNYIIYICAALALGAHTFTQIPANISNEILLISTEVTAFVGGISTMFGISNN